MILFRISLFPVISSIFKSSSLFFGLIRNRDVKSGLPSGIMAVHHFSTIMGVHLAQFSKSVNKRFQATRNTKDAKRNEHPHGRLNLWTDDVAIISIEVSSVKRYQAEKSFEEWRTSNEDASGDFSALRPARGGRGR